MMMMMMMMMIALSYTTSIYVNTVGFFGSLGPNTKHNQLWCQESKFDTGIHGF